MDYSKLTDKKLLERIEEIYGLEKVGGDSLDELARRFESRLSPTLPSDEEIEKEAEKYSASDQGRDQTSIFRKGFLDGAKWLRSQLSAKG